jgi:hypothetical protein
MTVLKLYPKNAAGEQSKSLKNGAVKELKLNRNGLNFELLE